MVCSAWFWTHLRALVCISFFLYQMALAYVMIGRTYILYSVCKFRCEKLCIVFESIAIHPIAVLWLGKMAKSLFIFSFFFFSGLTTQERSIGKNITWPKVTKSQSHHKWHHIRKSHDDHGKVVHRSCSSCISSIQNWTPLSSSYQLRFGVGLSCLG